MEPQKEPEKNKGYDRWKRHFEVRSYRIGKHKTETRSKEEEEEEEEEEEKEEEGKGEA